MCFSRKISESNRRIIPQERWSERSFEQVSRSVFVCFWATEGASPTDSSSEQVLICLLVIQSQGNGSRTISPQERWSERSFEHLLSSMCARFSGQSQSYEGHPEEKRKENREERREKERERKRESGLASTCCTPLSVSSPFVCF